MPRRHGDTEAQKVAHDVLYFLIIGTIGRVVIDEICRRRNIRQSYVSG